MLSDAKKQKRNDILAMFAVEPAHDLATFNRYVADYPQYARALRLLWRHIVVEEAKEQAKARRRAALTTATFTKGET